MSANRRILWEQEVICSYTTDQNASMKITDLQNPLFNAALDLFGLRSDEIDTFNLQPLDRKKGLWRMNIKLVPTYPKCEKCQCDTPKIHGYSHCVIKTDIMNNLQMEIHYQRRRYKCPSCFQTWSEENPFVFKGKLISSSTTINVLQDLKKPNETYKSISDRYHISPTTVQNILDSHIDYPGKRSLPRFLLIDEVYAFQSENSGYVCVLMDGDTGIPVDILDSRRKDYVLKFLSKYTKEERDKVEFFCSDMYEPYQDIAKAKFPEAIRSVDRFHVIQDLDRRVASARIRIQKGQYHGSDAYYLLKHQSRLLNIRPDAKVKGSKELVLDPAAPRVYNKHFRTYLNQYELLQKLLAVSPDIKEIYVLKNRLGSFFRDNEGDKVSPQERLNNFYLLVQRFAESSVEEMTSFAVLLEKWQEEILNSFVVYKVEYVINKKNGHVRRRERHLNSSLIENKNRVIQTLKRNANGFGNWKRFRNRVLYVLDPNLTFTLDPKTK